MSRTYPMSTDERARLYAATLFPGDVVEDSEKDLAEIRHLLPGALARRRMRLEWTGEQTWVVRASVPKEYPTFEEALEQLERAVSR